MNFHRLGNLLGTLLAVSAMLPAWSCSSREAASDINDPAPVILNPSTSPGATLKDTDASQRSIANELPGFRYPDAGAVCPLDLPSLPNIYLITIDALRADHLSFAGYARPTSPHIDTFTKQATVFSHTIAHSSETQTSIPALLTGRFPVSAQWEAIDPKDSIVTYLKSIGYQTAAFISNHWLSRKRGYADGFDQFRSFTYFYPPTDPTPKKPRLRKDGNAIIREAISFIKSAPSPRFVWIHLMDVHNPYQPPPPFAGTFVSLLGPQVGVDRYVNGPQPAATSPRDVQWMTARYDEGILHADALTGLLLEAIQSDTKAKNALTIITSDHGEELADHGGFGHGTSLNPEQIHVPLILQFPFLHFAGTSISDVVAHWDIVPTIRAIVSPHKPHSLDGTDLCSLASQRSRDPFGTVTAKRMIPSVQRSIFDSSMHYSLTIGDTQYYWKGSRKEPAILSWKLYATSLKLTPLYPAQHLWQALQKKVGSVDDRMIPPAISPDERARLNSLGYVSGP